jgi:hypothetical protein
LGGYAWRCPHVVDLIVQQDLVMSPNGEIDRAQPAVLLAAFLHQESPLFIIESVRVVNDYTKLRLGK